jgi:hypothetical protein
MTSLNIRNFILKLDRFLCISKICLSVKQPRLNSFRCAVKKRFWNAKIWMCITSYIHAASLQQCLFHRRADQVLHYCTFFSGENFGENSAEIFPLKNVGENLNFPRKSFEKWFPQEIPRKIPRIITSRGKKWTKNRPQLRKYIVFTKNSAISYIQKFDFETQEGIFPDYTKLLVITTLKDKKLWNAVVILLNWLWKHRKSISILPPYMAPYRSHGQTELKLSTWL